MNRPILSLRSDAPENGHRMPISRPQNTHNRSLREHGTLRALHGRRARQAGMGRCDRFAEFGRETPPLPPRRPGPYAGNPAEEALLCGIWEMLFVSPGKAARRFLPNSAKRSQRADLSRQRGPYLRGSYKLDAQFTMRPGATHAAPEAHSVPHRTCRVLSVPRLRFPALRRIRGRWRLGRSGVRFRTAPPS